MLMFGYPATRACVHTSQPFSQKAKYRENAGIRSHIAETREIFNELFTRASDAIWTGPMQCCDLMRGPGGSVCSYGPLATVCPYTGTHETVHAGEQVSASRGKIHDPPQSTE